MAEENKGQGLAWLLVGLGVGALVAILYAPKSGRETIEDIARGAREGTEYPSSFKAGCRAGGHAGGQGQRAGR